MFTFGIQITVAIDNWDLGDPLLVLCCIAFVWDLSYPLLTVVWFSDVIIIATCSVVVCVVLAVAVVFIVMRYRRYRERYGQHELLLNNDDDNDDVGNDET